MLGDKIKDLRVKNNITQEELAKEIYVTRNAISKWENNRGFPNLDSLKLLAKYFDISLDYLINDNEIKELTIKNNEMIVFNRNIIYSIILFIALIIVGTLLPFGISNYDPTAALVIYLIILPVIYVIFGVVSSILEIKWPFVIITGAISISPILIIYEILNMNIDVGIAFFVYYILFVAIYLLTSLLTHKLDKKYNNELLKKLLLIISIIVTSVFIIHTLINTVILILDKFSSAAYYTPLVINFFIYVIPLFITWSLFLYYANKNKRS